MSDNWDFYFCRVDGKPASIFVDLGLREEAPLPNLPRMLYLRLLMRQPREDGLSSREEFETLSAIEDKLNECLVAAGEYRMVGRNTSGGCRDFYFYGASERDWERRVADALAAHPEYRYETGSRDDREWGVYFEFLYPDGASWQSIQNRRTLEALENHGDKLERRRPVHHWIGFRNEAGRERFAAEATKLGLGVESRYESDSADEEYPHMLHIVREDLPSHDNIDEVVIPLYRLALEHDGDYDGWETSVEK